MINGYFNAHFLIQNLEFFVFYYSQIIIFIILFLSRKSQWASAI